MSRIEKKCVLASVVLHGLLVVVLIFGAAFKGKPDPAPTQRALLVPSKLIEEALAGGGGNPNLQRTDDQVKGNSLTPVAPTPPTPPAPKPPEPQTRATPPPPVPTRTQTEPKRTETPKQSDIKKPAETTKPTTKPPPQKPTLDLIPTVQNNTSKQKAEKEARAREAARQEANYRKELAKRFDQAATGLKEGFEPGTKVEVGGTGGEAYAGYALLVQTVYDAAWQVMPDLAAQDFVVPVEVVIARNGRVVSQRLITRSNNAAMDRSVQRALDKVKLQSLPPFPEGSHDAERTFRIKFNLNAKRFVG